MRILCIGDSNTWGYMPGSGGERFDNRWTKVLKNILVNDTVLEEGLNGRTIVMDDPGFPERNGIKYLPTILENNKEVDIIIIMLGTNELKVRFNLSSQQIAKHMQEFLDELYKYYDNNNLELPELLLVSPIEISEEVFNIEKVFVDFNEESYNVAKRFKEMYSEISKANVNCHFLAASDFISPSKIDCIHIDEENHYVLGKEIAKKILEIKTEK